MSSAFKDFEGNACSPNVTTSPSSRGSFTLCLSEYFPGLHLYIYLKYRYVYYLYKHTLHTNFDPYMRRTGIAQEYSNPTRGVSRCAMWVELGIVCETRKPYSSLWHSKIQPKYRVLNRTNCTFTGCGVPTIALGIPPNACLRQSSYAINWYLTILILFSSCYYHQTLISNQP